MNSIKTISVTFNKTVTVIESEVFVQNGLVANGCSKVFQFKSKKDFFAYASTQEAMQVKVSQNVKGFIKQMESLGFDLLVKDGMFETEKNIYCAK